MTFRNGKKPPSKSPPTGRINTAQQAPPLQEQFPVFRECDGDFHDPRTQVDGAIPTKGAKVQTPPSGLEAKFAESAALAMPEAADLSALAGPESFGTERTGSATKMGIGARYQLPAFREVMRLTQRGEFEAAQSVIARLRTGGADSTLIDELSDHLTAAKRDPAPRTSVGVDAYTTTAFPMINFSCAVFIDQPLSAQFDSDGARRYLDAYVTTHDLRYRPTLAHFFARETDSALKTVVREKINGFDLLLIEELYGLVLGKPNNEDVTRNAVICLNRFARNDFAYVLEDNQKRAVKRLLDAGFFSVVATIVTELKTDPVAVVVKQVLREELPLRIAQIVDSISDPTHDNLARAVILATGIAQLPTTVLLELGLGSQFDDEIMDSLLPALRTALINQIRGRGGRENGYVESYESYCYPESGSGPVGEAQRSYNTLRAFLDIPSEKRATVVDAIHTISNPIHRNSVPKAVGTLLAYASSKPVERERAKKLLEKTDTDAIDPRDAIKKAINAALLQLKRLEKDPTDRSFLETASIKWHSLVDPLLVYR